VRPKPGAKMLTSPTSSPDPSPHISAAADRNRQNSNDSISGNNSDRNSNDVHSNNSDSHSYGDREDDETKCFKLYSDVNIDSVEEDIVVNSISGVNSRSDNNTSSSSNNRNINFNFTMPSFLDCSRPAVRNIWLTLFICAVIVSIALIATSLKKLTSIEYGVEYDRWAKTLDDAAKTGGLHAGPPGYYFIKFPSTQITSDLSDTCVSRDGLRVKYDVTFQYQMPEEYIVDAIESYRDFKTWSQVVEAVSESAVQHTCSEFNVTDFQSKRTVIQDAMHLSLKIKLEGSENAITDDGVYALANSLQLNNVDIPQEYKDAIVSKQRAEEDIALAKNQRRQETTRAQTEKLAAEEEARKIMETAYNTGNVTIIEADLKAQETLFAFSKEKEILKQAQTNFNLTTNGILGYMSNQLYAKSTGRLDVSVGEPSRLSRKSLLKDEL